jgi:carbon monoxide dehydrogenase subunit G
MKFTNEIRLQLPADELFATLADVERVAPCLPGARLEGRDGDVHRGAMRVKVGPIVADYAGTLTFEELDPQGRRAVLLAKGEEKGGRGSAEARIVNAVHDDGDGARIVVETDLQVRGRVAQFGSGPMEKIAKRMFADFAKNLETLMATEGQEDDAHAAETGDHPAPQPSSPAPVPAPDATADSLDVVSLVAEPLLRSVRTVGVPVLLALLVGYVFGRRRARGAA